MNFTQDTDLATVASADPANFLIGQLPPGHESRTREMIFDRLATAEPDPRPHEPGGSPARRRSRRAWAIAVAVAAVAATPALALGHGALSRLFSFSTSGNPVRAAELSLSEATHLQHAGAVGTPAQVALRDGRAFYVVLNDRGGRCFGTGAALSAPQIDVLVCQGAGAFPSADQPVVDLSTLTGNGGTDVTVERLEGFAADGVAAVGVRDAAGRISWTPVTDNTYEDSASVSQATALVAKDDTGAMIFQRSLTHG